MLAPACREALEPQLAHKVCSKCTLRKNLDEFSRNKARKDGICVYCKLCNAAATAERRQLHVPVTVPTVSHKVCSECNCDLPSAYFHRVKSYKDGLNGKCKECCTAIISQRKVKRGLESLRRRSDESSVSKQFIAATEEFFIEEGTACTHLQSAMSAFAWSPVAPECLPYSDDETNPSAEMVSQADASWSTQWGDGEGVAKRQRLELDKWSSGVHAPMVTSYGHGEVALVEVLESPQLQPQQEDAQPITHSASLAGPPGARRGVSQATAASSGVRPYSCIPVLGMRRPPAPVSLLHPSRGFPGSLRAQQARCPQFAS